LWRRRLGLSRKETCSSSPEDPGPAQDECEIKKDGAEETQEAADVLRRLKIKRELLDHAQTHGDRSTTPSS
jgi:hypothetical protein